MVTKQDKSKSTSLYVYDEGTPDSLASLVGLQHDVWLYGNNADRVKELLEAIHQAAHRKGQEDMRERCVKHLENVEYGTGAKGSNMPMAVEMNNYAQAALYFEAERIAALAITDHPTEGE